MDLSYAASCDVRPVMGSRRNSYCVGVNTKTADRFIPRRRNSDFEASYAKLLAGKQKCSDSPHVASPEVMLEGESRASFQNRLASTGAYVSTQARILSFSSPTPTAARRGSITSIGSPLDTSYSGSAFSSPPAKPCRHVPSAPAGVREMSGARQDAQSSILCWSSTDLISAAIGSSIFSWSPSSDTCVELELDQSQSEDSYDVTCVAASPGGDFLAIGTTDGRYLSYDVKNESLELFSRCTCSQGAQVVAISWEPSSTPGTAAFYGARLCGCILRIAVGDEQSVRSVLEHSSVSAVHSLAVSPDGRYMALGSGAGEVMVYCTRQRRVVQIIEEAHHGAIKAMSWCPWQASYLATGSLGADGIIKLWNTTSCKQVSYVETDMEVRDLIWSRTTKELVSGHYCSSFDTIRLWRYPDLSPVASIDAHQGGVLQLALSPDTTTLASLGIDGTLKFWDCFKEVKRSTQRRGSAAMSSPLLATIR